MLEFDSIPIGKDYVSAYARKRGHVFSAFHALAVEDHRRWAHVPFRLLPASHIQGMVNTIESAIPIPKVE